MITYGLQGYGQSHTTYVCAMWRCSAFLIHTECAWGVGVNPLAHVQVSKRRWTEMVSLQWPFGGVCNVGWFSFPRLRLPVAVVPQLLGRWTGICVVSPHLQNTKPSPPWPGLTAGISTKHTDQLSSSKMLLTMGEARRWALRGMPTAFVPRL